MVLWFDNFLSDQEHKVFWTTAGFHLWPSLGGCQARWVTRRQLNQVFESQDNSLRCLVVRRLFVRTRTLGLRNHCRFPLGAKFGCQAILARRRRRRRRRTVVRHARRRAQRASGRRRWPRVPVAPDTGTSSGFLDGSVARCRVLVGPAGTGGGLDRRRVVAVVGARLLDHWRWVGRWYPALVKKFPKNDNIKKKMSVLYVSHVYK